MERYLVVAIEALQPRPAAGPTGDVSQPGVAGVNSATYGDFPAAGEAVASLPACFDDCLGLK